MIDYKLVEALVAVLEAGGFEKAAQWLHITQSAISQRIKLLEARLGRPVLVRSNPPAPTAIGRRLHTHMQRVRHLEQELGLEMAEPARVKARIAVNGDSLATWFAEALGQVGDSLLADLVIEDQDTGLERMKMGDVLACLCSARQPLSGARADALGTMRYRAFASPAFIKRYLQDPSTPLYALPCLVYNIDDQLQHRFLAALNQPPPSQIVTCPSSEGFVQLALNGCGFGMLPELQVGRQVRDGLLVDIIPDTFIDVPLYWHSWRSSAQVMQRLRAAVLATAKKVLNVTS